MSYVSLNRSDVFELDFEIQKGQTVEPVYITAENENFQESLVFAEIRRRPLGKQLATAFTASAIEGSNRVTLTYYGDRNNTREIILSQLDVKVGDKITVEGSGIDRFIVSKVSANSIEVVGNAQNTVNDSRLFIFSRVDTSFVAGASGSIFTVTIDGIDGSTLNINNLQANLPTGTKLVFNLETNSGTTVQEVTLTQPYTIGQPTISVDDTTGLSASHVSHCGVFTIITTSNTPVNSNTIAVDPLLASIPSGQWLYFGFRNESGWRYAGKARTTSAILKGATSIAVDNFQVEPYLNNTLPKDAIAWFGTFPFDRFYLAIDVRDMVDVRAGQAYGYDVMKWNNSVVSKMGGGKIIFRDNYTEVYE